MIRFEEVSHTYPNGVRVLDQVSLLAPLGMTTVLLGTSGSGKTTLMRMVNRMVEPTSGRVFVRGTDVASLDPVKLRRSIGYVLQDGGLFPHRKVLDNIATVPRLEGVPKSKCRARALDLLDLVGLDRSLAGRYPSQLSGGQRQRVGVARALANEADLLLMDEPFGAIDPLVRADIHAELKSLRQRVGTTILFVTHDLDEAFDLGDQIALLRSNGTLAQVGTGPQLALHPADEFVASFVGAAKKRALTSINTDSGQIITNEFGRPLGHLTSTSMGQRS